MQFSVIDSFAGAGGLSLGLKRAGFDLLYGFDNDPMSIKTQQDNRKYLPHETDVEDINDLDSQGLMTRFGLRKGELFLFAGGPPCQGFSIQRVGNDIDERNKLVTRYFDLVADLYPRYFLMENVPGIMGKRGLRIVSDLLARAEALGYKVHVQILDAQSYGVPQRRKRVFVIGERLDGKAASFVFPEPALTRRTVRDAIGHLPEPPENGSDHPDIPLHRRDRLSKQNLARIKALKPGQGMADLPTNLRAKCHVNGPEGIGHRNVYGRMPWDDVAPTITARFDSFTRGQFGHPIQPRSITLREGALLQTFPKDFSFYGNKVDVARQIGNAVPVALAEAVGKAIIKSHNAKETSGWHSKKFALST